MVRKKYHEVLRGYIKESGMSLSEIGEKLKEGHEFWIDKSYLSKLQNGKAGPATEKLNRAIAAVLQRDPEPLLDAAYYEKAPEELKERLDVLQQMEETHAQAKNVFEFSSKEVDEWIDDIQRQKRELLELEARHSAENQLKDVLEKHGEPVVSLIRVPVIGTIAAGTPILAAENIIDSEVIPNPGNYKSGDLFTLIVQGDSMIGSRIYEGDKVLVRVQPEVEDGEIAVVNVDGENATLKRVKRVNGSFVLFPDNPKYDPIIVKSNEARICGKVIQVIFDPNRKS